MDRYRRSVIAVAVTLAMVGTASLPAHAATIMKLNLGADAASDFQFNGGVLSTLSDGLPATTGSQNTSVEFLDILDPVAADIGANASFTMDGVLASNPCTMFSGSLVAQDFSEGSIAVYDEVNSLLLSAELSLSAVTGPLGAPNSKGLFLAFGEVTGGSMAQYITPGSLRLKFKLPAVTGGFTVSPMPDLPAPDEFSTSLGPFMASTMSVEILAEAIPEPAAAVLLGIGGTLLAATRRRRRG
jgi:hypothetical protein